MYFCHVKGFCLETIQTYKILLFLPVIKWNVAVSLKGHIRSFREAMIRGETEITLTEVKLRKSGQLAS